MPRSTSTAAALLAAALLPLAASPAAAQRTLSTPEAAKTFGQQEDVEDVALSPDGTKLLIVRPAKGRQNGALVVDLTTGKSTTAQFADGKPLRIAACDWITNTRVVCNYSGTAPIGGQQASFTRLIAADFDGENLRPLGNEDARYGATTRQYDGWVLEWGDGSDDTLLVAREYVPQRTTYQQVGSVIDGLGVDRINTMSLSVDHVEPARGDIVRYMTDGQGHVRMKASDNTDDQNRTLQGTTSYYYRLAGSDDWQKFGDYSGNSGDMWPLAVEGPTDSVLVLKTLDGRDALYRVALDGSMKTELVYANPKVDVANVVRIGREGRVIGASYVTDRRRVEYFDPAYKTLAAALAKAIPNLPVIRFVSASADENTLLILASSDDDPGRYYLFDKQAKRLKEILLARAPLQGVQLATVTPVRYRAADGQEVPAYLTLPPGSNGKGLPAIVMPHGGPAARDEWGFDWFAQYFANRGFAVLQPNYRGSTGYGDAWFADNGFRSWKLAVSDINDGGRWLVSQGIADPAKMAIVGWSYGGYAALQANVLDPDLFKAVIAVAPVTDLEMFKEEARMTTASRIVANYVGDGPHIEEGSPARHGGMFKAPVLMFHGDKDINVDIDESKRMESVLDDAGKQVDLVVYKGLGHQLEDSAARTNMLARSASFLSESLGL